MIYKLYRILASNSETFAQFTDGFKKGPKGIVKSIFLIILGLYLLFAFSALYVISMISTYKVLANAGTTELMPVIAMFVAFFVILFFGFTSVAASYYTGGGEEQFLTMPLTPAQFFGAKFSVAFVTDAVIGLALFAISAGVYGYNEGLLTNPLFYIGFIVSALAFSVVAVYLIYIIFILFLFFIPALRKKKLLTGLATVCVIVLAASYGMINSIVSSSLSSSSFAMERIGDAVGKLTEIGQSIPVLMFFSGALNGKIIPILILAAFTALILFVLVPLSGSMYIKTLNGFADIKTKKISAEKAEEVIKKDVRSVSIFHAVFIRDVRNVLREPAFLANGPLFVILFPIILIVSFGVGFVSSGENISVLISAIQEKIMEMPPEFLNSVKYYIVAGGIGYTIFSGTFSNVATTSFSREGKSLFDLKAMPIRNDIVIKAKFWHAMMYVGIAALIAILLINVLISVFSLPFYAADIFLMCLMILIGAATVSLPLIFVDMFIDTANPKLHWENPTAAVKQNMNVMWSVLLSLLICVLLIVFFVLLPKKLTSFLIVSVVFGIIAAPIGAGYFKYASKKYDRM